MINVQITEFANYIECEELFTDMFIAFLIINDDVIVHCNQLAIQLFEKNDLDVVVGNRVEDFLNGHTFAEDILILAENVKMKGESSRNCIGNDQAFYIRGKRLINDQFIIYIQDRSLTYQYEKLLHNKMQLESISHLAAGVAHELRNPLSVIQGFIQLSTMTNNFADYVDTILSEIKRMNQIIENFLSVSRKKNYKQWLKPEQLLKSVTDLIHSECLLKDIFFDYKLFTNDGYLYVNENMFKQVMLNLLRNTIEAYDKETKDRYFRLHAGKEAKDFIMMIEDNGSGMSEHVMKQLERPFYTTKATGTGIGITMCKKIVEEHDGTFTIESIQGIGTKIIIKLPLFKSAINNNANAEKSDNKEKV